MVIALGQWNVPDHVSAKVRVELCFVRETRVKYLKGDIVICRNTLKQRREILNGVRRDNGEFVHLLVELHTAVIVAAIFWALASAECGWSAAM